MTMLSDLLSTVFDRRVRFTGPAGEDSRSTEELTDALVSAAGEISGRTLGGRILDRYDDMDDAEKRDFFRHLTTSMDIIPGDVRSSLARYEAEPSKSAYRAFLEAAEPRRQELIRRLNGVPGATGRLVNMRADLLRLTRNDASLAALDLDFRHLFASWFNRGFLVLRPISWESPAHILEKIIAYEAVHAIDSWDDLRRRLEPADRRCFAFFHPAMPDEPLIFVEVALTRGIAGSVQALLSEDRPVLASEEADTAVFYSISNCQAGLAGISFGNSLIKQVAADLSRELPGIKTFVTLSPIPGFAGWLATARPGANSPDDDTLRALGAYYLTAAKRPDGLPLDPVARFHLGNGALVHKIHAGADTSEKGRAQSHGLMVNYHYDLRKISENHERFATAHTVAMSSEIRSLSATAAKLMTEEAR
ncbi:malonyl-CoA decarboxylase [Ovoidimarina sediminis]|uniref:malonyl-CoA decarboxylase n=1 Tax=Ovoidimarina sediminis TaxID=3079856 RepID=UPI00290DB699|nr:malonyl-CoA decarboxylase [Rhodophyticola sp. MJ-SS7]MDU8946552.1 malonyl-CoA decarboxylase [Rhodophyticola sp. MJ-SS7]